MASAGSQLSAQQIACIPRHSSTTLHPWVDLSPGLMTHRGWSKSILGLYRDYKNERKKRGQAYRFAALPLLGIFVLAGGAFGLIAGRRFGRSVDWPPSVPSWPPSVPSWPPLYVPPVLRHISFTTSSYMFYHLD